MKNKIKTKRKVRFNTVRYKTKGECDHHETHPAYVNFNGTMFWCFNHDLHRINGPASFSPGPPLLLTWYENNTRTRTHRDKR